MTEMTTSEHTPDDSLSDWHRHASLNDWKKAHAVVLIHSSDYTLSEVIASLVAIQESIREKRYLAATRALSTYQARKLELNKTNTEWVRSLTLYADETAIKNGLSSLENAANESNLNSLQSKLAKALLHPITAAEAHNLLGVMHALQSNTNEAKTELHLALGIDPCHYRAIMNLGNIELESGNFKAAENFYRDAMSINPDFEGLHHNLAVALRKQGKVADSVKSIRKSQLLALKSNKADAKEEAVAQFKATPKPIIITGIIVSIIIVAAFFLLR